MGQLIDSVIAIDRRRNKNGTWRHARPRLIEEVWPVMTPSFQLNPGGKIFTIGSCFARNIEEHLQRLGFEIPMLKFRVPAAEWPARANGILNKYTPPAIFQEIEWAKKIFVRDGKVQDQDCEPFLFDCGNDYCLDTNLGGFSLVSRSRYFERRCQIYDVFKELFSSDCVVLTLGLIEAWYDREKKNYIQEVPSGKLFLKSAQRFAFEVLSYEQCRDYVQRSVDAVREVNQNVKFLITTSPVPLARTFTTEDVITANMYSKSVLRVVAGDIANANDGMDYFPSYESVSGTKSWQIWHDDLIHVSDKFVGKVVSRLTETYCPGIEEPGKDVLVDDAALAEENPERTLDRGVQVNDGHSPEYYQRLSRTFEEKGEINAAVNELMKAMELFPAVDSVRYRLSQLLGQINRIDEAISQACYSLELDPTNVRYRRHLADLYARKRSYALALKHRILARLYRNQFRTKNVSMKRFLQMICRQGSSVHKS